MSVSLLRVVTADRVRTCPTSFSAPVRLGSLASSVKQVSIAAVAVVSFNLKCWSLQKLWAPASSLDFESRIHTLWIFAY